MTVTLALAGDTMLGRGVARTLASTPPEALVAPEVRAAFGQADLVVLNLECCISERGRRWVGGSVICDVEGARVAGPDFGASTVLVAEVDVAAALDKQISPRNHVFADRRTDLY